MHSKSGNKEKYLPVWMQDLINGKYYTKSRVLHFGQTSFFCQKIKTPFAISPHFLIVCTLLWGFYCYVIIPFKGCPKSYTVLYYKMHFNTFKYSRHLNWFLNVRVLCIF